MPIAARPLRPLLFALLLGSLGCHAQPPQAAAGALSPELARRVEVLLRARISVPPNYTVAIGPRTHSDIAGYDQINVVFSADGKSSNPVQFLLSTDGKTVAQFSKFDISGDPRQTVSAAGRPARGGSADAPVLIVGFDDLECPYCARMHAQLFPALEQRYGKEIRIVYRDFPLSQHPWAKRAAIDANCVAEQSGPGYWSLVDYVHAHASELGGAEKSLAKANETLDSLAREEGKRQKLNAAALDACIAKQDDSAVEASVKIAEGLGVDSTPALFINGEKLEGAYPIEDVYRMIDGALLAEGRTPPPAPAKPAEAASPGAKASAKPGS